MHLESCWTPCFWQSNVYDGSTAVSIYSIGMSIGIIIYSTYVMTSGDLSQLWLPYFEANLDTTIQAVCMCVIVYFLLVLFVSGLLLYGIRSGIRGFMLPWIYLIYGVVLFQAMFGLWLIFGYYINLEMIFAAICDCLLMCLNVYCIWVVKSQYTNIKMIPSRDIE